MHNEAWNYVLAFYDGLIEMGHDVRDQKELVERLANSKYAESIYPNTSVGTLCLSTETSYNESKKAPMLVITPMGADQFEVGFFSTPLRTHDCEKHRVTTAEVWDLVESLIFRLQKAKKEKETVNH
jgi:hypothetical protein